MEQMAQNHPPPSQPPRGHPHALPRVVKKHSRVTGKQYVVFRYPHQVLKVRSQKDLAEELAHYSHPMPMMEASPHAKGATAMRYLIEWVFPTLRWYCKVYNRTVPHWLEGKGWAEHLSKDEFKRIFGSEAPLDIYEWREDRHLAGKR